MYVVLKEKIYLDLIQTHHAPIIVIITTTKWSPWGIRPSTILYRNKISLKLGHENLVYLWSQVTSI